MNTGILSTYRLPSRLIAILLVVLILLPSVAPAFNDTRSIASSSSSPLTVFSNATSFTVADRASAAAPPGVASLYPSPITVSGMVGTISDVNVTVSNMTLPRSRDIEMLLVGPGGQKFILLSDGGGVCAISAVTVTFDDSAANPIPDTAAACAAGTTIATGSYRPTDIQFGVETDTFPSPAPAAPYLDPAPNGAATLATAFNTLNPNGTWNLYVIDDSLGGGTSTIGGGWSIDITTVGGIDPTTTIINSNLNPSLTTQSVTFTSTTTNNTTALPVTTGTVTFTNLGVNIPGCVAVAVNGSGQATCSVTLAEGTRTIAANYAGTATLGASSASLSQVVNSPTVVTGAQFCNNGGMTIVDAGTSAPVYPSQVTVSNMFGTVSKVTLSLNGFTSARPAHDDFLLFGPTGPSFMFMSDVGDSVNAASNLNFTFDDAAATSLPQTALASGTFRPTAYDPAADADTFPAPAPAGPYNEPAPIGAATFASLYGGTNPNGNWRVYAVDDAVAGGNSTITGWCLTFTLTPFATTTGVVSSQNPSLVGQSVTFTATVSSSAGTPTGNVQFLDGATPIGGPVALNGSGVAQLTTSALTAGAHTINVNYAGATVGAGGGGFATSTGNVVQNVSNTATWTGNTSGDWNAGTNWSTGVAPLLATNDVSIPAAGVVNNPVVNTSDVTVNGIAIGGTRTLTINSPRTVTANGLVALGTGQVVGTGTLILGNTGTITHGVGGQVNATLRKNFAAPGAAFEMPVGTTGQFSPIFVTVTTGSGQLTVKANTGVPAVLAPNSARTLQRYWTLSGAGIQSNIQFNYLDGDVPGPPNDETIWNIIRVTGTTAVRYAPTLPYVLMEPASNRFTISGLSSYSDWTAGEPLAPTAANAGVSGRVVDPNGQGVYGARVAMQNAAGVTVFAITNPFGYYSLPAVPSGETYLVSVEHKRYVFTARTISLDEDLTDLDFVGQPGENSAPELIDTPMKSKRRSP